MNQSRQTPSLVSTSGLSIVPIAPFAPPRLVSQATLRPRRFSPQDGRALELLGHAIEYLADEYALECRSRNCDLSGKPPEVQAIEMLMARSREIYFNGEPAPTLADRLRGWLGFARA